jgi:hypothetical protein
VAVLSTAWGLLLAVSGGFDTRVLGVRITTHEPLRPVLIAAVALTVFILSNGVVRTERRWLAAAVRIDDRWLAGVLAAGTLVLALAYSTTTASGSDAYGYVSEADLWIAGSLKVQQSWEAQIPWPSRLWSFAPLGYRPIEQDGVWADVPTYSAGLPLLMAAAKVVGGQCAMFWVVPLSGSLLVLATFGLGRRLGSSKAGLLGAWLVATSPAFLFMVMWPMTDVPVAAGWAVAFYFLLGETTTSAVLAGLAAALAILIRPNLFFEAGILGLWYLRVLVRDWRVGAAARRRTIVRAVAYGLAASTGAVAVALINQYLYGSPGTSGYGRLSDMFTMANVAPNIRNYAGWLVGSQTPLVLAGAAAVLVPVRRIWPGVKDRWIFAIAVLFMAAMAAEYCVYLVFDQWWYLRFLLACWPFLMVGLAAAGLSVMRMRRPVLTFAAAAVLVGLGVWTLHLSAQRGAFDNWRAERRYVSIARLVRQATGPNSVIFAAQHSGSLRYYAGRTTLRYDNLDHDWLDRSVAWMIAHGVHPYLLLEDWEIPDFQQHFAGQQLLSRLDQPPLVVYNGPATAMLYDFEPRAPDAATRTFHDRFVDTLRCALPAPYAPPVFR